MHSSAQQIIFKGAIIAGAAAVLSIATGVTIALTDATPVLIQSLESKTGENEAVFNRISFQPGIDRDVWMMQQSHHGSTADSTKWDRIAIVVKHEPPRSADFYQLEPGDLVWDENAKAVAKKAQCFMCHPNGPRAVRPDQGSSVAAVGVWNRFRLMVWNLRIKTYSRVIQPVQNLEADFRMQSKVANERLTVAACTPCHSESGLIRRGSLTRQNFTVIDFMLKNKLMPPAGFSLNEHDRQEIEKFIGRS